MNNKVNEYYWLKNLLKKKNVCINYFKKYIKSNFHFIYNTIAVNLL
jgi:hypothetical protein